MDLFYVIVVGVAIFLLIIMLTYIGMQMGSSAAASDTGFPPVKQTCPDKWTSILGSNNQVLCNIPSYAANSMKNAGNLYAADGTISPTIMAATPGLQTANNSSTIDFNHAAWSAYGLTPDCKQKEWANSYNIVWDGISNYNKC
jgi:hypothetical protein